ncbi:MAG: hypothetical protein GF418_06545 [Chitinivibrionales bacterium]|nr:hypothetical protein [Chitinivibrionales bacterium]MBD3395269.1 hypothetical protein [Chitinivibrionales bacterium]
MDACFGESRPIIEIPARIAPDQLEALKEQCDRVISEMGGEYALNMEGVEDIYSATLALIMHVYKVAMRMRSTLVIIHASERARNALRALKIDEKIRIYPSLLDYELACFGAATMSV